MTSEVEIANRAALLVGEDGDIISLDDDRKLARVLKLAFAPERDALLRAHPWNFARARARLAALTERPAFGFGFQYELPGDWLRFWQPGDERANYPDWSFTIEGRRILTDAQPPLDIVYIRRVADPALFDELFAQALAASLAAVIAVSITGSNDRREAAWTMRKEYLAEARRINGQEQPPQEPPVDDWIIARDGV